MCYIIFYFIFSYYVLLSYVHVILSYVLLHVIVTLFYFFICYSLLCYIYIFKLCYSYVMRHIFCVWPREILSSDWSFSNDQLMRLINGHWGWGIFLHWPFEFRSSNVERHINGFVFKFCRFVFNTAKCYMSSKFKVGSLTTQIMLAKSNLTAAFEDELAAQQKLSKQQAAAEKVSEKVQSSLRSSRSSKEKDRKNSSSSRSGWA